MSVVTIEDIAREVGCAPGTVSRALNDRKGVREQTKTRIIDAAKRMGYQPNAVAQSLVNKQTHLIALVVPDLTEPILSSIALAADEYLFEHGYATLLCNSGYDPQQMRQKMAYISRRRMDGMLFRPCDDNIDDLINSGLPTVLISHSCAGSVSYVDMENETAGYLGTRHLLDRGYRRVAFLGGPPLSHVKLRYQGYCRALKEAGMNVLPELCWNGEYTVQGGYEATKRLLQLPAPPDSIFSCNDRTAIGALMCATDSGLRIPEDFGIIGFNDDEMSAWPQIDLTTIRQPTKRMGYLAAKILLDQIEEGPDFVPQKVQIYPQIIERGTTRDLHA